MSPKKATSRKAPAPTAPARTAPAPTAPAPTEPAPTAPEMPAVLQPFLQQEEPEESGSQETSFEATEEAASTSRPKKSRVRASKREIPEYPWTNETTEVLAEFIKDHPCLFDKRQKDWLNVSAKNSLWDNIGRELEPPATGKCIFHIFLLVSFLFLWFFEIQCFLYIFFLLIPCIRFGDSTYVMSIQQKL